MNFLKNNYARVLTALLLIQGIVFYSVALARGKYPAGRTAGRFPNQCGRLGDV